MENDETVPVGDPSLTCDECGNIFTSISALNKHKKTARYCMRGADEEMRCECNYSTFIKFNYDRHIAACEVRAKMTELEEANATLTNNLTILKRAFDKQRAVVI